MRDDQLRPARVSLAARRASHRQEPCHRNHQRAAHHHAANEPVPSIEASTGSVSAGPEGWPR